MLYMCIHLISKMHILFCIDIKLSYFYEVGFKPSRIKIGHKEEVPRFPGYQLLFAAPDCNLFLKTFEETRQASKDQEIHIPMVKCNPVELLRINADLIPYVQEEMIRDALSPIFYHAGRFHSKVLNNGNSKKGTAIKINHEVIRTKAFLNFFLESELTDQFTFGHVALPSKHVKYPYSIYGRSLNDICVMHTNTTHYKSSNKAAGGIVIGKGNENSKFCEEKERIMDFDDEEFSTSLGVFEFKQKRFAVQQISQELLKSAGDLVAKVLLEGSVLSQASMYGLAVNYKEESAVLVVLHLNFLQDKASILYSDEDDPVDMCSAMNWLLNAITLK